MSIEAKITAVISFCSNDWRFLKRCIEGVSPFCHEIILTVCDHFFDGSFENYALLEEAYRCFPECTFIHFHFDPDQSYHLFSPLSPEDLNWRHEWHNTGRWLGSLYASALSQYLFFIDCDEIVDAPRFCLWLQQTDLASTAAWRFTSRCFYRDASYEALSPSDNCLLVNRSYLHSDLLWDERERFGVFYEIKGEKQCSVKDLLGQPLVRHFSGVRTKEEFAKKLTTWGHYWEQDWQALLEEEYSRPFNGKDFFGRLCYRIADVEFDPLAQEVPCPPYIDLDEYRSRLTQFPNVIDVSRSAAFKKDLQMQFLVN